VQTTSEQRTAARALRNLAGTAYRVDHDAEGWPLIPGRLGQIEHHDGTDLAVYTDRRRMHAKLLALPGVQRHQRGDDELRALFPPDALPLVAKAIRARRKRSADSARHLLAHAYTSTSRGADEPGSTNPTDKGPRPGRGTQMTAQATL
jgi:hypothetical protein